MMTEDELAEVETSLSMGPEYQVPASVYRTIARGLLSEVRRLRALLPESLVAAREGVEAAGIAADDLPDEFVPTVARAVEYVRDKRRLDWVEQYAVDLLYDHGSWTVRRDPRGGPGPTRRVLPLRSVIDAAMAASTAPADAEDDDFADSWCDWCHSFHPDATPHGSVPAGDEHEPIYRDRDAYRASRGRDMIDDMPAGMAAVRRSWQPPQ